MTRLFILFMIPLVLGTAWAGDGIHDLVSDRDSIQARLDLIASPDTKTIDIATFQLHADHVGMTLIAALIQAAQEGKKVRLLVDYRFVGAEPALVEYLQSAGIELRFHNPPEHFLEGALTKPWTLFSQANHRMHEKIFVVNDDRGIMGDKNYTKKFFRVDPTHKHRTMLGKEAYVEGEAAHEMTVHFGLLWDAPDVRKAPRWGALSEASRAAVVEKLMPYWAWMKKNQLARTGSWRRPLLAYESASLLRDDGLLEGEEGTRTTLAKILDAIAEAPPRSKILIENSYFVLFPELEEALKKALAKGCDIHVVLNSPEVSDQYIIGEALRVDLPKMINLGLNVYLNRESRRISHGKLVLIGDETVIIGSTNFDPRSYRINSEASLRVRSPELNRQHWARFEASNLNRNRLYWARSCEAAFLKAAPLAESGVLKRQLVEWLRPNL